MKRSVKTFIVSVSFDYFRRRLRAASSYRGKRYAVIFEFRRDRLTHLRGGKAIPRDVIKKIGKEAFKAIDF